MSITEQNSVLILGAGTSVPHGLALGGDLIGQLEKSIRSEVESTAYRERRNAIKGVLSNAQYFDKYPILRALAYKHDSEYALNEGLGYLEKLAGLLKNQTSETIDDFIVQNPSYSEFVKIAIAALFMASCYTIQNEQIHLSVKKFEERLSRQQIKYINERSETHFRRERNWVHLLINIVRHGIKEGRIDKYNKVKIITFNYDCILEYIFEKQFGNIEDPKGTYKNYQDYIDIVHVHGKCGHLEDEIYNPSEAVVEWAAGICVVNEDPISEEVLVARKKAQSMILNAHRVYAVGFSFSGPNCRLLDLNKLGPYAPTREINYCNYDGGLGLELMVNKFARSRVKIVSQKGTYEKPLSVVDWFRVGHVGEMPG